MGFFKEGDVIDYTLLQKRGLLKLPKPENEEKELGYASKESNASTNTSTNTNPLGGFFDFTNQGSSNSSSSAPSYPSANAGEDSQEVATLRVKIDDLEYKIDKLIERISELESKS